MTKAIVFVGPTLARADAITILDAEYRPPAQMGDIYAAVLNAPTAIGVVDGYFHSVPAVWHKEILFALAAGIHVYGAASIGALRAAELAVFGMRGIGAIFNMYNNGVLEDDDEVAVVHGAEEQEYRGMSTPMVDIRDGLRRAVACGIISEEPSKQLLVLQKNRFYADRSWTSVFDDAKRMGLASVTKFSEFINHDVMSLKRRDAIELVTVMAREIPDLLPFSPQFRLESSWVFRQSFRTSSSSVRDELSWTPPWTSGTVM